MRAYVPVHPKGEVVNKSSASSSTLELGLPWLPLFTIIGRPEGPDDFSNVVLMSSKFISEERELCPLLLGAGSFRGRERGAVEETLSVQRRRWKR